MFNKDDFIQDIQTQGFSIIKGVLPDFLITQLKIYLTKAIDHEVKYHGTKDYSDYGMVLICSLYGKIFCDIFDIELIREPFNLILGEGCIVYAYTSSSMPPHQSNYSQRIHTDCPRIIPGYITNIGATILLDDFTLDNGATWFLPFSQQISTQPKSDDFYYNAHRLIAKAGDVFFFNARIWHAGGQNFTNDWRHALTINMIRPWMKQRIDIPRAMKDIDLSNISEIAKQKLGFHAQVPSNYDEYYAPFENRKFKQRVE
ncbi:phytanoyl-CoA dioxygenase family protein [Candidatus Synechococcus calcipolaris G9]|uniref:Phytanoyl-CoA dioxygenase family protein n=1 Tax=Candidatus Synechococcus calcipolaris G9 TaxID=1497997 RepID=A0ABT6F3M2_9SYNE|nr:phytanoyl-CoA dioxygenase family protein [Candidatus Synechococcus calcipolaris]MDG2992414.1 phytanoyl-CoA dioxygenase family protein [Candidatus Synechococcus calcipolaris G9]